MAIVDVSEELKSLSSTMGSIEAVLDLDRMRDDIAALEEQAAAPSLWDDPENAQKITSRLSHLQAELRKVETLRGRIDDLSIMFELAETEDDADTRAEAEVELESVQKALDEMEVRTLLSGEYDAREALVNIRAEAAWCGRRRLRRAASAHVSALGRAPRLPDGGLRDLVRGRGRHQVDHLRGEGPLRLRHPLGRAGHAPAGPYLPFDNQGRRQTSFAGVEVLPVVEQSDHVEIDESELRVDVYRASGPGGQGVNTTDSAVRITHLPTGIVVSCQNERSQIQNKASAMNVLQAKLLERRRQEEQALMDSLGKSDGGNSWGNQMRSYVLHPYQMVKDLRTDHEVGNPHSVLDGDIDGFIEAGIRWRKSREKTAA